MKLEPEWARRRPTVHYHAGVTKEPFKDRYGRWWIYRSDDPEMVTPLGPFFTPAYAAEQEERARQQQAPLPAPLSHPLPKF